MAADRSRHEHAAGWSPPNGAGLYLRYVSAQVRAQLQYPGAFALQMIGTLLITTVEFVGVWALVHRFGNIRGWELPEVAILYGWSCSAFRCPR